MTFQGKRYSVFCRSVGDEEKSFLALAPALQ
jgi:hypothetical protein